MDSRSLNSTSSSADPARSSGPASPACLTSVLPTCSETGPCSNSPSLNLPASSRIQRELRRSANRSVLALKWPGNAATGCLKQADSSAIEGFASIRRCNESSYNEQTTMSNPDRLPTYFISHGGGPWPWLKEQMPGIYAQLEASLAGIHRQIGRNPRAVLMISGHWEQPDFTVMSSPKPGMLYDYSGFPEFTYSIKYS